MKKFLNSHREFKMQYLETSAKEGTNIENYSNIFIMEMKIKNKSNRMVSINLNDEELESTTKDKIIAALFFDLHKKFN